MQGNGKAPILAQASQDDDKEGGFIDKGDDASSSALDFEFVFEYFNQIRVVNLGRHFSRFLKILR